MNEEGQELQSMSIESGTVALLNKSEIDMQIATAHRYPRSIKRFRDESLQMVTLNEQIAESCIYALPRDGKVIEGPSARFAEVTASAWGNCRAGARVVSDQGEFVTAQGVFHDLERNVAITYEVQRRIVDKHGRRFKPDMIGVTANAACSIALRNAILKGIPKAFWDGTYQAARKTVMGDFQTLANRREAALKAFQAFGVNEARVMARLGVSGIEDVTLEHLVTLRGLLTAIRDGDTTPEQAFAQEGDATTADRPSATKAPPTYPADQFAKNLPTWRQLIADGKKTAEQIIAMAQSKGVLSDSQKAAISAPAQPASEFDKLKSALERANDIDTLDAAADLIGEIENEHDRSDLTAIYHARREAIEAV